MLISPPPFDFDFNDLIDQFWKFVCALFFAILGYLFPIKDIVHLLIICFIIDVGVGFWAARKLRHEHFNPSIIWSKTVPRVLLSIVIISLCYAWDAVYVQSVMSSYIIVGWAFTGLVIFSIAKNAYKITGWKIFEKIADLFSNKVKDQTGMDITEKEVENG